MWNQINHVDRNEIAKAASCRRLSVGRDSSKIFILPSGEMMVASTIPLVHPRRYVSKLPR
jgi:hypothetical protein